MSSSFDFLKIILKGKSEHECLLGPGLQIWETDTGNSYLLYKSLQDVYAEHKDKFEITGMATAEAPMLLDSEKFSHLSGKSPALEYLAEKFDCEML